MHKLAKTEYKSSAQADDPNRFLNSKEIQSLTEPFNDFLLDNYHYERGTVLGQIYSAANCESQLLMMAHCLFSELHLFRGALDAKDKRRDVLLDAACDLAIFIQKMCGVWIL